MERNSELINTHESDKQPERKNRRWTVEHKKKFSERMKRYWEEKKETLRRIPKSLNASLRSSYQLKNIHEDDCN